MTSNTDYPNRYLSNIAYSLGEIKSVDALIGPDVSPDVIKDLKKNGIEHFCADQRSTPEMCIATAMKTLETSSLQPNQIDAIVFGNSNAIWNLENEYALLKAFHHAGFVRTRIIGLSMQACSATGSALRMAADLIGPRSQTKNVLVILTGRNTDKSRVAPHGPNLFSDGAASCLVSSESKEFEILASESLTSPSLTALTWTAENSVQYFNAGVLALRDVLKRIFKQTSIGAKDIAAVFGTNGNLGVLNIIGLAAGVQPDLVYSSDLARFGHVYACDNLMGLKNYPNETPMQDGGYYLLVSWAPYVVSATLLRYVAAD